MKNNMCNKCLHHVVCKEYGKLEADTFCMYFLPDLGTTLYRVIEAGYGCRPVLRRHVTSVQVTIDNLFPLSKEIGTSVFLSSNDAEEEINRRENWVDY